MENTANTPAIKKTQLLALALWVFPELVNLFTYCCKIFGCNSPFDVWADNPFYYVYWTTVVLTTATAMLLLSKMAAKPATTIVLRRMVLPVMAIGLLSIAFDFYKFYIGISSNILVSGVLSLIFLTKTTVWLYIFGVIDRENKEHKEGCRALYGYFWVSYIITFLFGNCYIFYNSTMVMNIGSILFNIAGLIFTYKFLTSAIFCGEKNCEPIEKGTFKFWNKFFTQFIIIFFGGSLLLGILGIIIN